MVPEQDQRLHFNDVAGLEQRGLAADAVLTLDCTGVGRLAGSLVGRLLVLPRSVVVHFVDGDPELFEALALMAGGRDWRFDSGFGLTRIPIRLKPAALEGEWNIHLAGDADWAGWMKDHESVTWIRRLDCHCLWIDMVDIGHLRSVVIGWLLSLRQEVEQVPIRLLNVDPRANSVLQQMRLCSVFEIDGECVDREDAAAERKVVDR